MQVIAFDNLKRRGSELNIARLRNHGVEFVHGDIRNPEDLNSVGAIDLLLECSAEPSVLAGYDSSPSYLINTNLIGTINCLELARVHQAHFVFLSTSRVYPVAPLNQIPLTTSTNRFELGDTAQLPAGVNSNGINEGFTLAGTRSLYGATKLASELILQEYCEMYGMQGIINRCGVLTGPWQMGKVDQGVVVLWVARHYFKGELSYIGYGGQGLQVRDVLHVLDLYELLKIQLEQIERYSGQVFNVGGGLKLSLSLKELTQLCQDYTGNRIPIKQIQENRQADIPYYISDTNKINQISGWHPKISLNNLIEEITLWVHQNENVLKSILN